MMPTLSLIARFVCTLFLISMPLCAEQVTPSASYQETLKQFLEISRTNAILKEINGDELIKQITKEQDMTETQVNKITHIVHNAFSSIIKDLESQMPLLYSKYYTEQDLQDLIAFYQTPAGKKLATNAVAIFNDSQKLAQTIMSQYLPKMESQIRQILTGSKK